ncbi:hypothetical protein [Polymorphospora lycopeni]|uniref:Uncharacterized protein n=1 Tax=Polymorphospora lycopeni TaxID=3140240 RepID=A0ABV5D231_9ACTN
MTSHAEQITADSVDDTHTDESDRLAPGVYLNNPQGHARVVGVNQRELCVLDLGGLVSVGGIEIRNPDDLDRLAVRLAENAARLRARLANRDAAIIERNAI